MKEPACSIMHDISVVIWFRSFPLSLGSVWWSTHSCRNIISLCLSYSFQVAKSSARQRSPWHFDKYPRLSCTWFRFLWHQIRNFLCLSNALIRRYPILGMPSFVGCYSYKTCFQYRLVHESMWIIGRAPEGQKLFRLSNPLSPHYIICPQ